MPGAGLRPGGSTGGFRAWFACVLSFPIRAGEGDVVITVFPCPWHRWASAPLIVGGLAVLVGCAPTGGPVAREDVVEIETIEMAPAAGGKPVASAATDTAQAIDASRQDVDARAAAADSAIAAASQSAPPATPAGEKPPLAEPAANPQSQQPSEKVQLGDPSLTAGVPGTGPITLAQIDEWLSDNKNFRLLDPVLPLGLSQGAGQITGLDANPLTRAKIELGRQLYFDTRLSVDSTVSCASCHDPSMGYSAHTKTGVGIRSQAGGRNSPVSFNRILSGKQFWDGRVDSLEAQAVGPIQNPIEMGFTHEGVVKRLSENPVYKKQFDAIFGELTIDRVGQAIAAFERALVTEPSPYDYYEQLLPFTKMDAEDIADDDELARPDPRGGEQGHALVATAGELAGGGEPPQKPAGGGVEFGCRADARAPLGHEDDNGLGIDGVWAGGGLAGDGAGTSDRQELARHGLSLRETSRRFQGPR